MLRTTTKGNTNWFPEAVEQCDLPHEPQGTLA